MFFSADINDHYVKYFWNISYKNYESFIKRLEKLEKKNLSQTVELLSERLKLQEIVENSYDKHKILSNSKSKKDSNRLKNDISDLEKENQVNIVNSINKIKKIALNTFLLDDEYIELLIENEKSEQKPGFKQRVEEMKRIKEQLKFMKEIYENKNF